MQKLKVLIADDNPRMASMIQNILMDDDEIQVVGTAEDGVETLGMIEETEPDLLLLDLIMPKLDGLGVMERLQEKQKMKKVPEIIVVSGISQERITDTAFALGASYYLLKPFESETLLSLMYRNLNRVRGQNSLLREMRTEEMKKWRNIILNQMLPISFMKSGCRHI